MGYIHNISGAKAVVANIKQGLLDVANNHIYIEQTRDTLDMNVQ